MNYRTLGRTHLEVSELGFGALEIGRPWPDWRKDLSESSPPSESDAIRLLDMAVDLGINFFDTAPAYFRSEEIIGKAFRRKRNGLVIATKCGEWFDGRTSVYNYSASETLKFIETSLRLLQTDRIDLLQIHSATAAIVRSGETLSAMKKAREQGKVRFLGLSTKEEEAARLAIESGEYDCVQVSYNILEQDFAHEIFPLAERKNIGIIIKAGMAAGQLTSKYLEIDEKEKREKIAAILRIANENGAGLDECALRFALTPTMVSTVIIGTKNASHLKSNVATSARGKLDEALARQLMQSFRS